MLKLKVCSLDKTLFEGAVTLLHLPGSCGQMCVLAGHTPMILSLSDGLVRWQEQGNNLSCLFISGGVVDVTPTHVELIALSPQRHEDIDMDHLEHIKNLLFQDLSREMQPLSLRRIKRQLDLTQKKLQAFRAYKKLL